MKHGRPTPLDSENDNAILQTLVRIEANAAATLEVLAMGKLLSSEREELVAEKTAQAQRRAGTSPVNS